MSSMTVILASVLLAGAAHAAPWQSHGGSSSDGHYSSNGHYSSKAVSSSHGPHSSNAAYSSNSGYRFNSTHNSTSTQSSNSPLYNQVVSTQYGDVQGYPAFNATPSQNLTNWADITVWKGIPFAASTAGSNRWRAPQPVSAWTGTLDARNYGAICPSSSGSREYTVSEDCLNLNIWSAATSTDSKLPVVMWSYPAYSTAADNLFDGAGMADAGVVYVNYNYRTGALGWLAHPELSEERLEAVGYNSSGNYGMLDQFAALKWIHENIEAFGGDPDQITVMGQSAGSAATLHILNSPLTKGLIVGAIIESGVRDPHDPLSSSLAENYRNLTFALEQGVEYLADKNSTSIAAARELDYTTFASDAQFSFGSTATSYTFTATLDYYAMPDTYYNTLIKGAANDVPVITGNTRDESGATYGLNITVDTYLSDLNSTYDGVWVDRFLELYPAANSSQASASENQQFTDRSKVGTWLWANMWRDSAESPIWTYIWDHAPPGQNQGAYHESEINYVLNNLYATDKDWTAEDYEIAETMNAYWVNFIKYQNPNGKSFSRSESWASSRGNTWRTSNGNSTDLAFWAKSDDTQFTMRLGDGFQPTRIAEPARVSLIRSWFNTLPVF